MPTWIDPSGLKGGSLDLLRVVAVGTGRRAPPGPATTSLPSAPRQDASALPPLDISALLRFDNRIGLLAKAAKLNIT